jgi:hypothetical protein
MLYIKTNINFFYHISLSSTDHENVLDKICREHQNTHFVSNNFFPPKLVPFMRYAHHQEYNIVDYRI